MSNIFCDFHTHTNNVQKDSEYSRILTAAVVNEKFRKLLLNNPGLAIQRGFSGESFNFGAEESRRIAAIHATTLAEFARQMNSRPVHIAAPSID
jgi:hypothetical protein